MPLPPWLLPSALASFFCFSFAPFLPSFLWEKLLAPMLQLAYDFSFYKGYISGQITALIIHTPENLLKIIILYKLLITSLFPVQIPCAWVGDFVRHEQVLGRHLGSKTFGLLPVVLTGQRNFSSAMSPFWLVNNYVKIIILISKNVKWKTIVILVLLIETSGA